LPLNRVEIQHYIYRSCFSTLDLACVLTLRLWGSSDEHLIRRPCPHPESYHSFLDQSTGTTDLTTTFLTKLLFPSANDSLTTRLATIALKNIRPPLLRHQKDSAFETTRRETIRFCRCTTDSTDLKLQQVPPAQICNVSSS
jgi:hypothetical protein